MKYLFSIIFICFTISISADDTEDMFDIGRMNINISQGTNGDTNPNIQLPISWNESIFSEISYSSYENTTVQDLISVTGKSSSYTKVTNLSLSLSYLHKLSKQHTLTLGLLATYKDSLGSEFGYYEVNATTNSINLDVNFKEYKVGVKGDYTYIGTKIPFNFRVGFILYPYSKLNLEQDSIISGGIGEGSNSSTSTQDISYSIYLAMQYPIYKDTLFLGINANLNHTPLEYESIVLDPNTYQYATAQITHEEKFSKIDYKLIYKQFKNSPINYVLGYSQQKTNIILEDNKEEDTKGMLILGVERRF